VIYPAKIADRLRALEHLRPPAKKDAAGISVSFCCGSFIRFNLVADTRMSIIEDVIFQSNGCGHMLATAEVLAESLSGRELTGLHGLNDLVMRQVIESNLGAVVIGRSECVDSCIQALHSALSNHRTLRIEEFAGEKALICTCFGVTEERIETIIRAGNIETVEDVSAECNAGLGCGSCRMMIEEMLDLRRLD